MAHLVETEVDGLTSVYDPITARVHVLNRTASDAWLLSDGQHSAEQIVTLLADAYHTGADEIRAAIMGTVEVFQTEGLLCREDGPA